MRMWALPLAVAAVLATSGVARADTWTVTVHGDPDTGSVCPGSNCSLRQAVATAPDGTTIVFFEPGTYAVDDGAPVVIPRGVTVDGGAPGSVTIDASGNRDHAHNDTPYRTFITEAPGIVLQNLTLKGGDDGGDETCAHGCDTIDATGGGAIWNTGGLWLDHVRFTGNGAPVGGAVSSSGTLDMRDVEFSGDYAGFGGGLFIRGGTAEGQGVTFHDEGTTAFGGGAAYVFGGSLALTNSTVTNTGSPSSFAGGVENYGGSLTLNQVTLDQNLRGAIMTDTGASTTVTDSVIGTGFNEGTDFACVRAGIDRERGKKTIAAITSDGGHNLDADGQCGLTGPGDRTGDPHLAPLADNGGATPTMALLHDSPALDGGAGCTATDQRGFDRGATCDIGAFDAIRDAVPASASTRPATDVGPYGATLHATVNLSGESGGAHFLYGTAQDQLISTSGVGASGRGTDAAFALGGLVPNTTYYFQAVADNASGQRTAGDVQSFTTGPAPPGVTPPEASGIDDTSVSLSFVVDTGGADASYVIQYGPDGNYGQSTAPVHLDAQPQEQQITTRLTGLTPGTTYHLNIVVTNASAPDGVSSGDSEFATDGRVSGASGTPVTITDRTGADFCPDTASIDWGDGATTPGVPVTCEGNFFSVSASHAYAAPGRFRILIDYDGGQQSQQWAVIAQPAQATPTPAPTPTPQPTATPTPTPPAPQFHQQVVVKPVSGTVLVRVKGSKKFVPVNAATGVPLGSQVDVTHGRIQLTSVPKRGGKPQTAVFYGGIFTVTQPGAITDLALSGPKPTCTPKGKAAAAAKKKKVKSRGLWGNGHGNFRTRGTYSAATVRGTQWLVQDTCAGTLTRVVHGVVSVRDNVRHKTRLLRAGQRYLARPRTR